MQGKGRGFGPLPPRLVHDFKQRGATQPLHFQLMAAPQQTKAVATLLGSTDHQGQLC
jgi:hypothetical protein